MTNAVIGFAPLPILTWLANIYLLLGLGLKMGKEKEKFCYIWSLSFKRFFSLKISN